MNLQHVAALVQDGQAVTFIARGNSMSPKIRNGEVVTVEPVSPERVKLGAIVLARVRGHWYLHLISGVEKDRVQISNNHGRVNGWTPRSEVVGRLVPRV